MGNYLIRYHCRHHRPDAGGADSSPDSSAVAWTQYLIPADSDAAAKRHACENYVHAADYVPVPMEGAQLLLPKDVIQGCQVLRLVKVLDQAGERGGGRSAEQPAP